MVHGHVHRQVAARGPLDPLDQLAQLPQASMSTNGIRGPLYVQTGASCAGKPFGFAGPSVLHCSATGGSVDRRECTGGVDAASPVTSTFA